MADVERGNRPLSPHLQVYTLGLTMIVSGLHRITGVGMIVSAILIVWWFIALAISPDYFAFVDGVLTTWIGLLVMIGSLWAFFHHLLNGIRHLFWDKGYFLDKPAVEKGARIVLFGAPILMVLSVILIAAI